MSIGKKLKGVSMKDNSNKYYQMESKATLTKKRQREEEGKVKKKYGQEAFKTKEKTRKAIKEVSEAKEPVKKRLAYRNLRRIHKMQYPKTTERIQKKRFNKAKSSKNFEHEVIEHKKYASKLNRRNLVGKNRYTGVKSGAFSESTKKTLMKEYADEGEELVEKKVRVRDIGTGKKVNTATQSEKHGAVMLQPTSVRYLKKQKVLDLQNNPIVLVKWDKGLRIMNGHHRTNELKNRLGPKSKKKVTVAYFKET